MNTRRDDVLGTQLRVRLLSRGRTRDPQGSLPTCGQALEEQRRPEEASQTHDQLHDVQEPSLRVVPFCRGHAECWS